MLKKGRFVCIWTCPAHCVILSLFGETFVVLLWTTNSAWCKAASCETMWAEHLHCITLTSKSITSVCVCVYGIILDIDLSYKSISVRINAGKVCELTNLVRKHVAGDLVGNDVRIICEDVVEDGAVILPWNRMKKRIRRKQSSRVALKKEEAPRVTSPCWFISPPSHLPPPLALICSHPSPKIYPLTPLSLIFFFRSLSPAAGQDDKSGSDLFIPNDRLILVIRIRKIKL